MSEGSKIAQLDRGSGGNVDKCILVGMAERRWFHCAVGCIVVVSIPN